MNKSHGVSDALQYFQPRQHHVQYRYFPLVARKRKYAERIERHPNLKDFIAKKRSSTLFDALLAAEDNTIRTELERVAQANDVVEVATEKDFLVFKWLGNHERSALTAKLRLRCNTPPGKTPAIISNRASWSSKTPMFRDFQAIWGCGRFSGRPRRPAPAASCGRLSYRTPCALPRRTPSASPPGTSGSTRRARRRTARRRPRASPSRGRTRP